MPSKMCRAVGTLMLGHLRTCGFSTVRHFARASCPALWNTTVLHENASSPQGIRLLMGSPVPPMRNYSSKKSQRPSIPNVDYAVIKSLPQHPEKLLIDVREPNELTETGIIPTSINIPLETVVRVLAADVKPQIFQKKFGRPKPVEDSEIIFSCRSGKRAHKAAEIASAMGFKNAKYYGGSWEDWAENEGLAK